MTSLVQRPAFRFLLVAAVALLLAGCAMFEEPGNNSRSLNDLVGHFDQSGLRIGEMQHAISAAIGAEQGYVMMIEGARVEIYRFDRLKPRIDEKLKRIAKTGSITICGIDFPAEVNGSFVLLTYTQHEKRDEIIKAFQRF